MADFSYEVKETLAVLSESTRGWRTELNLVSWNGNEPKYDIRSWNDDHTKMGKGITLTDEELRILAAELFDRGFC